MNEKGEGITRKGIIPVAIIIFLLIPFTVFAARDSYKLGAQDIIEVSIFAGGEQQVAAELTVSDEGMINFPFLGSVQASGMSSSELELAITVPLKQDYFVDPQVHISIKEYHSLHFSISGAVRTPGKYEMKSTTTIMDLIAKAEGVTLERGNIAYILRDGSPKQNDENTSLSESGAEKNTEPLKINLIKLLDEGDMSHNITLLPGDSVYIPLSKGLNQADSKVYVAGEVERPDLYPYQPGLTALSVCIMAGGFAKYAAPNRTTIVRIENGEQKIIKIDLEDVIEGKIPDIPLKPGDRVNIPESWF
ncbi:polysaccharide biosynthesis/export family protein [Thermodesulfobacteriota bacterium]